MVPPPFPLLSQRPARLGIVGLGWAATHAHLPALTQLRSNGRAFELAALCDLDAARLQAVGAAWPEAQCASRAEGLLSDRSLDGLLILTHPHSSGSLLQEARKLPRPIFVEKPVVDNLASAARLVGAVGDAGAIIQVGYNRRHQPLFARFSELTRALPRPLHLRVQFWRSCRSAAHFYLDTIVHPIELLIGLFGPLRVEHAFRIEDAATHIDAGWQVLLSPEEHEDVTAEIDIRPNTGIDVERYTSIGAGRSVVWQYPFHAPAAMESSLKVIENGIPQVLTATPLRADNVAQNCIEQGFVSQMDQFLAIAAGQCTRPTCTLGHAAEAIETYFGICGKLQPLRLRAALARTSRT